MGCTRDDKAQEEGDLRLGGCPHESTDQGENGALDPGLSPQRGYSGTWWLYLLGYCGAVLRRAWLYNPSFAEMQPEKRRCVSWTPVLSTMCSLANRENQTREGENVKQVRREGLVEGELWKKKGEGEDEAVRTRERDRSDAKEPLLGFQPFTSSRSSRAEHVRFRQLPEPVTMMMECWARAGLGLGWPFRCYSTKGSTVASPRAEQLGTGVG